MAKLTKKELISDIELRVNQGAVSDDSELDWRQIAQWISEELNGLVAQECAAAQKQGLQVPSIYVTRETSKALTEEDIPEVAEPNERMYFTLTGRVLDVPDDGGIILITDDQNNRIYKGGIYDMISIRNMRYAKPSSDQLVWYRQGDNIFVEGFTQADIDLNTIIVNYIKFQDVEALNDIDYVYASDVILTTLKERVTNIAMKQMYGSTADPSNDGIDMKNPAYHELIKSSPNQQLNATVGQ